jgi:hypothetical protein
MPARDYSPVIDTAGTGILILSLLGIFTHGIIRIISKRRMKKRA